MALQEVDLCIFYKPGKKNILADALSQAPILGAEDAAPLPSMDIVTAVTRPVVVAESREGSLSSQQREDVWL